MDADTRWLGQATFRFRALLVCVVIWGISLIMPALTIRFDPGSDAQVLLGYQVLLSGWIGLAYLQLGWLANPLLAVMLATWLMRRRSRLWARSAALMLILASAWTMDLPLRPAFHRHEGFGPGYWFWLINNLSTAALVLYTTRGGRE